MKGNGMRLAASLMVIAVGAGGGCGLDVEAPGGGELKIEVAPLSLEGITDASYTFTVINGLGEVVWTRTITSDQYGDGAGSISYIGTCDASAGARSNTVQLVLERLEDSSGVLVDGVDFTNPAPAGRPLEITQDCLPDADLRVRFDLTVARAANQGFFDVAVEFDDLFCSAKLDCVDDQGAPLRLLHDASGARNTTAVLGLACTGGQQTGTQIYRDPIVIDCGGQVVTVNPTEGPGLLSVGSGISGAGGILYGASVVRGGEQLGYGKLYWNVLLGLEGGAASCRLTTTATAADHALDGYATPAGSSYPYIEWDVNLTDASGALVCTQHPLNGVGAAAGVSIAYTAIDTPRSFAYSFQAPSALFNEGLILRWTFDEGAAGSCPGGGDACDLSGLGNHGDWVGGVSASSAGYIGGAVSLDGSSGYIRELTPSGWAGGDHSLTTMGWFKADAGFASPNGRPVVALGTTADRGHFYTRAFSDPGWSAFNACGGTSMITLGADDGAADMWHCSGVDTQLSRWYHVASTYDSATRTVALYVDGVLAISQVLSAPLNLGDPIYAGHDEYPSEFFSGLIDEVRVYDRALPASTIAAIYAADQATAAGCSDGLLNGDETAVDCGGRCSASCARDCQEVLAGHPLAGDGVYSIDPDGVGGSAPFDTYCDMTTDGGGWTLVKFSSITCLTGGSTNCYCGEVDTSFSGSWQGIAGAQVHGHNPSEWGGVDTPIFDSRYAPLTWAEGRFVLTSGTNTYCQEHPERRFWEVYSYVDYPDCVGATNEYTGVAFHKYGTHWCTAPGTSNDIDWVYFIR